MSDDLLAELASLKDAPTPAPAPALAPTTIKPTIDFSDPKYGGEIPNFQSYWKIMADHLQPMEGFKPFKSTKSDEMYVLCVMPWKHGKYITNIPIDVTKDQNGKYVTFQKKELKKGEVEKIKTHLLTHFEKCMANGTLPVDLAHFVKVNNYIDDIKGMMVYRADLINVIKELIPKATEEAVAPKENDPPTKEKVVVVEPPLPHKEKVVAVASTKEKVVVAAPPPHLPSLGEHDLYDFINEFVKDKNKPLTYFLNTEGYEKYEEEKDDVIGLNVEETALLNKINTNKRYLDMDHLMGFLPRKIAKRCI